MSTTATKTAPAATAVEAVPAWAAAFAGPGVSTAPPSASPFALDVQVITDARPGDPTACTTNDGCAASCASACASRG
jgi:FxLD family lantipeptide